MPLHPRVTEVERLLFCSDLVAIGSFRCPAEHPLFPSLGPASGYLMAFPRTSTKIVFRAGQTVTASSPVVLFYNSGEEYQRKKIDPLDASDWYMIRADVVREIVSRHDAGAEERATNLFRFSSAPASSASYLTQRRLFNALQAKASDSLHVEETVIALLHDAIRQSALAHTKRARKPRRDAGPCDIEAVKTLMAAAPARNLDLNTLAASAGCTPLRLCREFRATTGFTMTDYRHALRLRAALDLLRSTNDDLTELALRLGYSSHSHFTAFFRRHFGMTPSEFRGLSTLTAAEVKCRV